MKGDMEREKRTFKQEMKDDSNLRRLAVVVRDSNDAVTVQDFTSRILAWNLGAERMYGYTEKEALGMNVLDLVPQECREENRRMLAGLAKGEPVTSFETRRLTKDGRVLDVWLIVTTLPDEEGRIRAFSTTERDITERKRKEQELIIANKELAFQNREKEKRADELIIANKELIYQNEEKEKRAEELKKAVADLRRSNEELQQSRDALKASEALLPAAIDILPVGLWIIDAEGKIVTSSAAAQRIWAGVRYVGIDQLGEYKGWRTDSGKPIEAHEWAGARALEKGETTIEQEVEIVCFDGTHKIILDSAVPLRRSDGSIGGAVTINQDITERRRAEEALHLANAYNRSLIEASLDPLVTIGRDGKITDVNAATEKVTGYSRQDLVGNDFLEYFLEPEKARAGYQRVFKEGCVVDYPLEIRHKDGRITSVLYNASVYRDEKGEVSGVFAAARDITERKRAEEALRRAVADLKRSNEELQQFAYVASHDLQEPLRAVASFTQLLSERYKGKLDKDADEFIAFAVGGANRMQTLINDLLSYSRLETRGKPPEPVDSHDALGRALANLGTAIRESGALVTNDDLPKVLADESQLAQLFQNLVGNAVKFHGKEPPRVHVSAVSQGNEWLFSVRDNGIGIAQEYHERIFSIFQRLHSREEYPGTGIGLALCKRIVERHGGTIRVESEPGSGSTFFFTLPKP